MGTLKTEMNMQLASQMFLEERRKPENPEKNLSVQSREPANSPTYDPKSGNRSLATLVGGECSPLRHPLKRSSRLSTFCFRFFSLYCLVQGGTSSYPSLPQICPEMQEIKCTQISMTAERCPKLPFFPTSVSPVF